MGFVIIISLLFFSILNRNNRNVLSKRCTFVILAFWAFLFIMSLSNPLGLYKVSNSTYSLLLLFLCSFTIGTTIIKNYEKSIVDNSYRIKLIKAFETISLNKFILAYIVFCDIFLLNLYFIQEALLANISASEIRLEGVQDYLFEGNSVMGLVNNMLVTPMSFFVNIFFAYLLIFKRKAMFPMIIYGIFIFLNAYIGGSRGSLIKVFIFVVFFFYCCPFWVKEINIKKTIKSITAITLSAIIAFSVVSYMTNQRVHDENDFTQENVEAGINVLSTHFVTYLVGPFRALDYALKNDYPRRMGGFKYGLSTLGCFDEGIELIAKRLGFNYERANKEIYSILQHNWINIPHDFNFAYTAVFNFYMDFGVLGICFIPFFIGGIIKTISYKYFKTGNPIILMTAAYMFWVVFETYFTWRMYKFPALLTLVWLYVFNILYKNRLFDIR